MHPFQALRSCAARGAALAALSAPVLLSAAYAPPAGAGAPLSPAAIEYLASARFSQALLAALGEQEAAAPPCGGATRVELRELRSLQDIVMDGGPHPDTGLWIVRVEAERCGASRAHSIFFSARHGAAPASTPLPEEDPRATGAGRKGSL